MGTYSLQVLAKRLAGAVQHVAAQDYNDEFVTRLRQLNTGLVRKGNVAAIRKATTLMPEGDVLEIGTFTGFSTNVISYFCHKLAKRKARVFSCDRWDYAFKGVRAGQTIVNTGLTYAEWSEFAKSTAVRNVSFFSRGEPVHIIEALSHQFMEAWAASAELEDVSGARVTLGGKIAFAFIDGNHDYEAVRNDLELIRPHLAEGGLVLFDDSAFITGSPGVVKLMKEIGRLPSYSNFRLISKHPNLLFRSEALK